MEMVSIIGSILAVIISFVSLIKVVVGVSNTMTEFSCSIKNLTEKLDKTIDSLEQQRKDIDEIKIQIAKMDRM